MDRPTVFISSTIYDFRDLRSAIKDYMEERGCRVLASDYNDFTKPLDRHSYQACLETIEQADLFLLLIGSRVGGWYDEKKRISITQQEYRTAYAFAQCGQLRLLSFVRADVWTHRQSTKELERHLKSISELDHTLRQSVTRFPTGFMEDAEFIVSFIDEVSRNKETAAAVKGDGPLPVGNWVHTFTGFANIRQALDPLILRGMSVRDAAGRKALQNQLLTLLRGVLPSLSKGRTANPANSIRKLAREINLTTKNLTGDVTLTDEMWNTFVHLSVLAPNTIADAAPLAAVLGTDLLLQYDPRTGAFHQTPLYDALTDLVDKIRNFERAKLHSKLAETIPYGKTGRRADRSIILPGQLVGFQLHLLFRWAEVVGLARALARALEGAPLELPAPMPRSPFLDEEAALAQQEISMQQARAFVGLPSAVAAPATPEPSTTPAPKTRGPDGAAQNDPVQEE
jgi:hypothetical protein